MHLLLLFILYLFSCLPCARSESDHCILLRHEAIDTSTHESLQSATVPSFQSSPIDALWWPRPHLQTLASPIDAIPASVAQYYLFKFDRAQLLGHTLRTPIDRARFLRAALASHYSDDSVTAIGYVPHNTLLVSCTPQFAARIAESGMVRFVAPFPKHVKLGDTTRAWLDRDGASEFLPSSGAPKYDILLPPPPHPNKLLIVNV